MNKVTELLDAAAVVITNVRNLADSLQAAADILSEFKTEEVMEQKSLPQIPEKVEKPKNEKAKEYTLEDVRGVLAARSQAGYSAEVRAIVSKYGASKLSEIDPKNYAEVLKDAEVIGNE